MAEDNKKKDAKEKESNMENATPVRDISFMTMEEKLEVARQIAQMYIERFPRPLYYGATIQFFDEDYHIYYHQLTDEEMEIIKAWKNYPVDEEEDDWGNLGDYLYNNHRDLFEKLAEYDFPGEFVALESCDIDSPLKLTKFSIQKIKEDGSLDVPRGKYCPLTDDEFVELLAQCLLESGNISMNNLVYRAPEITPKIIQYLLRGYLGEYNGPAICDADELKEITRSILDPAQDVLHLSESEDIRILALLKKK